MKKRKIVYIEPADYFPKQIRKKYKLGEYANAKETIKNKVCKKEPGTDKQNLICER